MKVILEMSLSQFTSLIKETEDWSRTVHLPIPDITYQKKKLRELNFVNQEERKKLSKKELEYEIQINTIYGYIHELKVLQVIPEEDKA